jgi:nitroreductase
MTKAQTNVKLNGHANGPNQPMSAQNSQGKPSLDKDMAEQLIVSRRTVHDFRPEALPRGTILRAIELACRAPNHRATEPWHFYLIGHQTQEAITQLNARLVAASRGGAAGEQKLRRWRQIPGWMAVTCNVSKDPLTMKEDYAACCCAIQNFALYLWSAGIGAKWTTGEVTRHADFYDLIWVDQEAETLVGLVWYGYPAEIPDTSRKGLDQVLVELP